MNPETESTNTNRASYSPEDDKLRLFVGRVPRAEYEKLRAEGWTSTPKQNCDFVAVWTPTRRDTALEYADIIEDEDQGPEDRAADRAERFGEYRDKRTAEATGHADSYDAGPQAHGHQSAARAERSARRHDRSAGRACDSWSKAEYWQRRTAGVISHALYKSRPDVRMGRIKTIEAELRKERASMEQRTRLFKFWKTIEATTDAEKQTKAALLLAGSISMWSKYPHPVTGREESLYSLLDHPEHPITGAQACAFFFSNHSEPAQENDWTEHYTLRLAYENQMLEAQGGRAAFVEMVAGGWIGKHQIRKVNKSPATGRVVSVTLKMLGNRWGNEAKPGEFYLKAFNIERLPEDAYRAPSAEDIEALTETKTAEKAAAPKASCPLVNPTDADAERLQAIWNADSRNPATVARMTQADYSTRSQGTYSSFKTVTVSEFGTEHRGPQIMRERERCKIFKVRTAPAGGFNSADRVLIITDKPQKAIPFDVMEAERAKQPSIESMTPRLPEIAAALGESWLTDKTTPLLRDAEYVGWVNIQSMSQFYWTEAGREALEQFTPKATTATQPDLITA